MPARRSRRPTARHTPCADQTTGSAKSKGPAVRPPPVRRSARLRQEPPVSLPPTPLPFQHPTPFLQPDTPTPATSQSATPIPATPQPATPAPLSTTPTALPYLEPENPTAGNSSLAILPPTPSSSTLPLHFRGHRIFEKAHDFAIYGPQFNESSPTGFGIKELLNHSMPDAFYNSSARYPPPKCHLGTRNEYITLITNWVLGVSDRIEPILWMRGPFGIGKSAVAQSCAEALAPLNKLAATLFFSRSNGDRDDPQRVFTSIAYQIAVKYPSFREKVNQRMIDDPALATVSLSTQFEELLVHPLRSVDVTGSGLDGRVVIIDGLDECRGTAEQCEIIRVITASVRKRTTPFRWFITSRPEDPIIRTMNSAPVSPVSSCIELPVSRTIDHEILLYLTDEFKKIREDYGLAELWPSEGALSLLVERGAGLWIYVATMIRFIKDENSLGPEDQLRIVVEFAKEVSAKVGEDNPLAEMDFFYTLIMQRVPAKVRTTVRKILLLDFILPFRMYSVAGALPLSIEQFRRVCASIQSVVKVEGFIEFYHTSFLDFMTDPQRSKELCILGDFLVGWRQELLRWLHEVCSRSTDSSHIVFPSSTVIPEGLPHVDHYRFVLEAFWTLCSLREHPFDFRTATSLAEIPFKKMLRLVDDESTWWITASQVKDNLPAELCDKVVRKGHGENESAPHQRETAQQKLFLWSSPAERLTAERS
ncbi:hypothetical protein D9756_005187 [Leucocoprinus leucothites]|uniref:Nephrocystin 3-like N-terminal domain-containing protein n=1 Tax=Leucocoprinus leucothites TaxID=201217 RepID=A0A8H5G8K6_9AGAR|nr:hypothetical protein D9756_005187 [Leucoagaricus leucothites]